jgi:hypothetical protein
VYPESGYWRRKPMFRELTSPISWLVLYQLQQIIWGLENVITIKKGVYISNFNSKSSKLTLGPSETQTNVKLLYTQITRATYSGSNIDTF